MDDLHEELLSRRPHGNAKDESVRDALQLALKELINDEDGAGAFFYVVPVVKPQFEDFATLMAR